MRTTLHTGTFIFMFHSLRLLLWCLFPVYLTSRTVHRKTSCSTHQTCIPTRSTLLTSAEAKIFVEKQEDIHEPGVLHDIFSLILVFPAGTTQQTGLRWVSRYMGGDKSAPELQDGKPPYNRFPTDVYYLGNLIREDYMEVRNSVFETAPLGSQFA